jgi:hypothetical protein
MKGLFGRAQNANDFMAPEENFAEATHQFVATLAASLS